MPDPSLDALLQFALADDGCTVEEHLLYLAGPDSHSRLRNANLPRSASERMVQELLRRGYLSIHSVPRDSNGSIVEYLLQGAGVQRLNQLRAARVKP